MGVRRLRVVRTTFRPRPDDVIINWGSRVFRPNVGLWLNHPYAVDVAQCKLASLITMQRAGVPVPMFTIDPGVAENWLQDRAPVVARTLLRASGARGLVLVQPGDEVPVAPLYTRYEKKRHEYRIHVIRIGDSYELLDIQQKRRRTGQECDSQVRNAANGWVYCRENVAAPETAIEASIRAVGALGLDFGAVDLGWNEYRAAPCVYEVNTAPGLDGTTPERYGEALYRAINARGT